MLMLDIPFQVSEEDLRRCLVCNLQVIENIVVDVDDTTWLQWQDKRAARQSYTQQLCVSNQESVLDDDDDDDVSFVKEENIVSEPQMFIKEEPVENKNLQYLPQPRNSVRSFGNFLQKFHGGKQNVKKRQRRSPVATMTQKSFKQKRTSQYQSQHLQQYPVPTSIDTWTNNIQYARVPPLHGNDSDPINDPLAARHDIPVESEESQNNSFTGYDDSEFVANQCYSDSMQQTMSVKVEDLEEHEGLELPPQLQNDGGTDMFVGNDAGSSVQMAAQSGNSGDTSWQLDVATDRKSRHVKPRFGVLPGSVFMATQDNVVRPGGVRPDGVGDMKECKFCRVMVSSHELKSHEATHRKTVYVCVVCQRSVSTSKGLEIHMRSHNGEKPYMCKFCNGKFSDESNCKRHIRKHHSTDKDVVKVGYLVLKA